MQQKLTKRIVDGLENGMVWDTEVRGFGLRCRNGSKHYFLKYRAGKRQRWISIGRHGSAWTPDSAREEAKRLIGLKAGGQDPAMDRDREKGVITVKQLATRFLDTYVPQHCKPRTAHEYKRLVDRFIIPVMGQHRISDVLPADVVGFHHDLRRRPTQANRALNALATMFKLAEKWGLRDKNTNPCSDVTRNKENKRKRYLKPEEWQRLGRALADAGAKGVNPYAIAALMLLILTGGRLSEILTLKWDFIDWDNSAIRLPDSKTGAKDIPLNGHAVAVLRALPRMENNAYVIAGRPGTHFAKLHQPWNRIKKAANLPDMRVHDLRHSFASVAVSRVKLGLPMVGGILGHTQASTTARYAHLAADPMKQASDLIGNEIMTLMGPV